MPFIEVNNNKPVPNSPQQPAGDQNQTQQNNPPAVPVSNTTNNNQGNLQSAQVVESAPIAPAASTTAPAPTDTNESQVPVETPNIKPIGELNSLDIPEAVVNEQPSMQQSQSQLASTDASVEMNQDGIKSMTGPALNNPAPEPSALNTNNQQQSSTEEVNNSQIKNNSLPPVAPAVPTSEVTSDSSATDSQSLPTEGNSQHQGSVVNSKETPVTPATTVTPANSVTQEVPDRNNNNNQSGGPQAETGMKTAESNDSTIPSEFTAETLLPADTPLEQLMDIAKEQGASDIHYTAKYPVMFRVNGKLIPITKPLTPEQAEIHSMSLLNEKQRKKLKEDLEMDLSYTNKNKIRFRVNLFIQRGVMAGALRLIVDKIKTMEELNLPEILKDITKEPHGLVLVVGPTGSGKSTTLASMINSINQKRSEHILTIEDPIEYVYPLGKSIVNQRELEADTTSWGRSLKSALREDPNVVLVGEMRDLDTIESTITIAETGHLTFATLHTNSAAQAIDRIIDVFPEGAKEQIRAQLANVVVAVISQRLIPVNSGGRAAALEVMLGTVAVRNAIREGKTYQIDNIIQTSGDLGMITLEKSLVELVKRNEISIEQAKEYSFKPEDIDSLLERT